MATFDCIFEHNVSLVVLQVDALAVDSAFVAFGGDGGFDGKAGGDAAGAIGCSFSNF